MRSGFGQGSVERQLFSVLLMMFPEGARGVAGCCKIVLAFRS